MVTLDNMAMRKNTGQRLGKTNKSHVQAGCLGNRKASCEEYRHAMNLITVVCGIQLEREWNECETLYRIQWRGDDKDNFLVQRTQPMHQKA